MLLLSLNDHFCMRIWERIAQKTCWVQTSDESSNRNGNTKSALANPLKELRSVSSFLVQFSLGLRRRAHEYIFFYSTDA